MAKKAEKNKQKQSFDGQRPDEKLLFIFRRHVITMRKGLYLWLIIFVLSTVPPLVWSGNIELFLLPVVGCVVGFMIFLYHFILWYFTIFIVTDQRIRQITQRGLFAREVIDLRLSKIQNISYNIPGFSGEMFKFGTIVIQTYVGDLIIKNVERPVEIYNKLQDAMSNVIDSKGKYEEDI